MSTHVDAKDRQPQRKIFQLVGRESSHFTRVVRMLALELGITVELLPVYDLTSLDVSQYEGNPALKIPTLRTDQELLFGTENICRGLAEYAEQMGSSVRVVWPEQLRSNVARSAQEIVWHSMAAQVQLILAGYLGKIPNDNPYVMKVRQGYEGSLRWLEEHLASVLELLPTPRDVSLFEVTLFCLLEHIVFRPMVSLEPYPALRQFAVDYAKRPSAQSTPLRMDRRPTA